MEYVTWNNELGFVNFERINKNFKLIIELKIVWIIKEWIILNEWKINELKNMNCK